MHSIKSLMCMNRSKCSAVSFQQNPNKPRPLGFASQILSADGRMLTNRRRAKTWDNRVRSDLLTTSYDCFWRR